MDTAETPASGQRPEDLHLAVLTLGERLVEAPFTRRANLKVQRVIIEIYQSYTTTGILYTSRINTHCALCITGAKEAI